jgi:hypothetical protein
MKEVKAEAVEAPVKPIPVVRHYAKESRLQLSRHVQNPWVYIVEADVPYEAVLKPDYWKQCATKFVPYDPMEVRREDGAWIGWLRVIDHGANWVKVVEERPPLMLDEHPSDRAVPIDGHTVKWNGPYDKWAIIRDYDKAKIQAGFLHRADALVWLQGHLKALAN